MTTSSEALEEKPLSFKDIIRIPHLQEAVARLGFEEPTPAQQKAIPVLQDGEDVIVQAQTGSGKTLAYALPLLHHLNEVPADKFSGAACALVLAPTRELAMQVLEVVQSLQVDIKPVLLIGGTSIEAQRKQLREDARLVIATPGRLLDLMRQRVLSLQSCRHFVLDEVDEMLSLGFIEDVRAILTRLPKESQGVFVSATITPRVRVLSSGFLQKPFEITVDEAGKDLPPIEHIVYRISGELMRKPNALCDIIETRRPRSAIVFCNTKSDTELIEGVLRRRGFDARRLNSDLSQPQRDRIMKMIRSGSLQFLIATDIAARGIDIAQIEMVFNYSIHEEPEVYVHRTGRTGRAGRSGFAVSLVAPQDVVPFNKVQKEVDAEFVEHELPTEEEIANARLVHIHEILRASGIDAEERDKAAAAKMLRDLGDINDPPDELTNAIGALCSSVRQQQISIETKALDEETASNEESKSGEQRGRQGGSRGRQRGRSDGRRGGRSNRGSRK